MRRSAPKFLSGTLVLLAGLLLPAGPEALHAAVAPDGVRFPGVPIQRPAEFVGQAREQRVTPGTPGPGEFADGHPAWQVWASPWSGGTSRAFGPGIALPDTPGGLVENARAWVAATPALMAPPVADLGPGQILPGEIGPGGVRWVRFPQNHGGIPVLGASLSLAVREGRVVFVGSRVLAPVRVPLRPRLQPEAALQEVRRYSGEPTLLAMRPAELALAPRLASAGMREILTHDLVWRLQVLAAGDDAIEMHHAWVDARNGAVLAFYPDAVHMACAADGRATRGVVRGGIRPNRADDPEVVVDLVRAPVESLAGLQVTDDAGRYDYSGAPAWSDLQGDRFKISCEDCSMVQPYAEADAVGLIDFGTGGGSAGPVVTGNGRSTPGERTAFYKLEEMRQLLDFYGTDIVPDLRIQVNIGNVCNARSGSYRLEFFQEGSGCHNTAEIGDVVHHELGHSWDRFDGNDITDGGMSEWKGDMMALILGDDSCIGESFRINPGAGATAGCSGVRDIDELAAGRQDLPSSPTTGCPECPTLTRSARQSVCGSSVHCTGQVAGQAIWHLYQNLLTGKDYGAGNSPLPGKNPAMSPFQARRLLARWLLAGGAAMETWDPQAAGVSIYDAMLVADDNDGNLNNGSPHAAYINLAFDHHEITEASAVSDASNCPLPDEPVATAVVETGDGGLPQVRLEWLAGPGETYNVLRRRFNHQFFLPVARQLDQGHYLDLDVWAGGNWEYLVEAVSTDSCAMPSAGESVLNVTVDVPGFSMGNVTVTEVVGDGDGQVEPGETAAVNFDVSEVGGLAGASGLVASLEALDPFLSVVDGGPYPMPDLPAGATVAPTSPFLVAIAPDLPCAAEPAAVVQLTAAETCAATAVRLPLATVCDADGVAFVRPVPGSLVWLSDTGDGDGQADNCEWTTFQYRLQNHGTVDSGAVSATVTALSPGVEVVGGGAWSGPGLEPGASVLPQFTVDVNGLEGPDVARFAIQAAAVAAPGVVTVDMTVPAEGDAPVYGTQSYDFEDGEQGWTADGFRLSTVRATSGTTSFHGGDPARNWLCQKLLSPVFHLDPAGGNLLTMQVYANIEPVSGGTWWDRANVHLIEQDSGRHVLLESSTGHAYNAQAASSLAGQLCHVDLEDGWAGSLTPFRLATFDLSPWKGRAIQIEVNYSSDGGDDREGFYVDDVTFTGVASLPPDGQPDSCTPVPEVSARGSSQPLRVSQEGTAARISWEDLGAGMAYNVYTGAVGDFYSHGAAPVACASQGVTCDGVRCSVLEAAPQSDMVYYLVTATGGGRQGPSGFTHAGGLRDPAANSCLP